MRFQVLKNFQAKNGNRAIEIKAGQIITLPDDKAEVLLAKGLIKPELNIDEKLTIGDHKETTGQVTRQEIEAITKPLDLDIKALTQMPVRDFEKAGLCLKIWSEVLQEEIFFMSNTRVIPGNLPEGAVFYIARELQALVSQRVKLEGLRLIHDGKRIFNGATISQANRR